MIKSVTVKKYILIDEITLEFDKGFNVFTGETGAGKSIIIGAIDTALGAKISKDVIKTGCDRAYVELLIELKPDFDKTPFLENGIEVDNNELVVSREILSTTTRSRINGVLVTQEFIKDIREKLLDIHSQHQSYNYLQQKNHLTLLDNFALRPHRDNVELFKEKYSLYLSKQRKLEEVQNVVNTTQQQEEFLKFQIQEIENACIEDVDECEKLEKELDILYNVEKLKELSYSSYWALYGDDGNILNALGSVKSNLSKLSSMDESIYPLEEDFINTYETLKEIATQLRNYSDLKENDNERMDFIGERLSLLDKIKRKYGNSLEEVLKTYEDLSEQLNKIEFSQDEVVVLEREIKEIKQELIELSTVISSARKELASVLSQAVTNELEKLELPKARFSISVETCNMNENGIDRVEFLISTNVSETLKPLAKTASGGEISRVMLAIKSIFAQADKTNTVIFDEIDTGISGSASQAVAESIVNLAKTHQIILITHQPIIAARATTHFFVKKIQADTTKVNVYNLQEENRVKAIALLSAGEINEESMAFAKKLLNV
ncbi:MAG: DNA repair protein RecN [Candidatus Gastranaerophilales bacterium]|nr:DNA repair protein RecN [Candidatus Gastranaerophilales bacterium]